MIQEGAILEKALPQTTQMTLEQLRIFYGKYTRRHDDFRRSGKPGRFPFFSPRAHLLTTCKTGGGIPPCGQARALFTNCLSAISPERAGNAAGGHSLCSRLYALLNQQNDVVHIATLSRRLPAKTCHRQLYRTIGYVMFSDTPIFSLQEKQKQEKNERR